MGGGRDSGRGGTGRRLLRSAGADAELSLRVAVRVCGVAEQACAFTELVKGRPVPLVRLSRERLLAPGA